MSDLSLFEEFFKSAGVEVVPCPRCGEMALTGDPINEDARPFQRSRDLTVGLCANCSVARWFQNGPFAEMIGDPNKLLFPPIQVQFGELMKAGNSDMKLEEISWELVVKHWDLPFPKKGKRRG